MNRRHTIFALLVIVALGVGFLVSCSRDSVPGRASLDAVLEDLEAGKGEAKERAAKAIRALGTNALPALLELLRTNDFAEANQPVKKGLPANRASVESHLRLERGHRQAITAFECLGSEARPAIQTLAELLQHRETAGSAAYALAAIGSEVMSPLTNALASDDSLIRAAAAGALGSVHCDAKPAVPGLVACLKDRDAAVRYRAAASLARIGKEPGTVVPALCEALKDADANVRAKATVALRAFGSEAKPAVPALLEALADPDQEVRESAEVTLKVVDEKAAAAAGVK